MSESSFLLREELATVGQVSARGIDAPSLMAAYLRRESQMAAQPEGPQ